MTDNDYPDDDPSARRPWWRAPVIWGTVLSIAIAAYELTALPVLAVVTVSLKMGWERFATAFWLWQRDPNRPRGRACFWLYIGSGFWVAALTGFALMFVFPFFLEKPAAAPAGGKQPDPVLAVFTGAAIAWLLGMLLSAVAILIAVASAWRNGLRLWLHGDVSLARERGQWPPNYGQTNKAFFPILMALLIGLATILTVLSVIVHETSEAIGQPIPKKIGLTMLLLSYLLVLPVATLVVWDRVRKETFAREPWDCWDDPPPPE